MKRWIGVDVLCGGEACDDLAAEVTESFGVGVEFIQNGIRFYLEGENLSPESESELRQILERYKEFLPPESSEGGYSTHPLADDDWAHRWKSFFKPLRVGRHFLVCPTWEEPNPLEGDILIRLDPGMAFGTGHHETTRLCMEWLETWAAGQGDVSSRRVLDVGTGSGILAMCSVLLGVREAVGVDNDPEAVQVARENVDLNGLADKIRLFDGSASDMGDRFDAVVANIQSNPLIEMAPVMVTRLAEAGAMALSGILIEQKEDVRAAYEAQGLRLTSEKHSGEWCLLEFRRSGKDG